MGPPVKKPHLLKQPSLPSAFLSLRSSCVVRRGLTNGQDFKISRQWAVMCGGKMEINGGIGNLEIKQMWSFEDANPLWGFALHLPWLWMWKILIAKCLNGCVLDRFWVIVWVTCCFLLRLLIFQQEWNQILGDLTSVHFCPAMEFPNPQNHHLASD